MKNSNRILALFAVILMLAILACNGTSAIPSSENNNEQPMADSDITSGDSSPSVNAAGIDACALLTKADAETVLGQPVKDPEHPVEGAATFNVTSCKYQVATEGVFERTSLIVTVPANGDLGAAQAAFNVDKTTSLEMFGVEAVDVPGLGDQAFWVGGSGNNLAILKGNIHLILVVSTYEGEAPPQPVIDLANTILSRLP